MSGAAHPDVTGAALDAQYDMRSAVPTWKYYLDLWESESATARGRLRCTLDIAYGPAEEERLDVFVPARSTFGAPVQILIHGGYWRALTKSCFSFLAPPLTAGGTIAVALSYGLCPAYTMTEIVAQCRRAFDWTRAHIAEFGGDPENIHVTGHSAGAHLAVMVALDRPARSVCALSGLYDLEPVSRCFVQEDLRLTKTEIVALSPMDQSLSPDRRLLLAAGAAETEAFRWHTNAYAARCRARGLDCTSLTVPGEHHYSIVNALAQPGPLQAAWLELGAP